MQLQLKPINKLTYKLRLTPQMKLAINLLQMPLAKLKEFIKQQLEENPLLEIENVKVLAKLKGKSESDSGIENDKEFELDFPVSDEAPFEQENYNLDDEGRQNYRESLITHPPTFQEHLLRQLRLLSNSEEDYRIGELIIGNIDDNGYLRCPIEGIVKSAKTVPTKVEKVLYLIQAFDPIGVGARNLRECLLLQLKTKGEENSLAGNIVDKYLPFLEKKKYKYIAKKLGVPTEKVKEAIKEIAKLEPKPGRAFNTETTVRLIPDALLRKNKEGYEVMLNEWELPQITINDKYRKMLKQKKSPEDAKEYLRQRLKAAHALINAVTKRKETIQKVIEEIIYAQKDFLDNGANNFKPLTLEQIAKKIGKHKSTVSRAVAGKYLQTPWGIFELRYFLDSKIKQENGEFYSSKAIKSKIKELIINEDKENPLTDQEVVNLFKQERISISRRTITKYRHQLKVLSSQSRKQ